MSAYTVVIEKSTYGYGAYVPDLPGCAAVGDTVEEVRQLIAEGIQIHLAGLREDGEPFPEPTSLAYLVEVI